MNTAAEILVTRQSASKAISSAGYDKFGCDVSWLSYAGSTKNFWETTKKWKVVRLSERSAWDLECDDQTTGGIIAQLEMRGVAIDPCESCLCVSQPDPSSAAPGLDELFSLNARTIVFHFDSHHTVARRCSHLDATGG